MTTCPICCDGATFVGERGKYRLWRCRACSALFVAPLPASVDDIYGDDYFHGATAGFGYVDYDNDKAPMEETFERYLCDIDGLLTTGGKTLFDIGAATGVFLNLARARGWSVSGVEVSRVASQTAREKGLQVYTGTLDEGLSMFPESIDVVTMWDVLEHLMNPTQTIASVHRVLKPGGILAITTPDSSSAVARLFGLHWHLVVPPEHLILFGRTSLRVLLEHAGFTVCKVTRVGKRFTLQYVVQTLARLHNRPLWTRVGDVLRRSGLGRCRVTIDLRDNITVFARKPL